jgi:hypothetical protein
VEKHCQKALCLPSTHEYVHYELEFDLNNPHVLTKEEIWKLMVPNIFEDVEEAIVVLR